MGMDAFERDAAPSYAAAHAAADAADALAWPPPLLEPILGVAWRISWAALAGGVFVRRIGCVPRVEGEGPRGAGPLAR